MVAWAAARNCHRALDESGYKSAIEVTLKISADFAPVPDVIATAGLIELPYPTQPVDIVVEILSPEDSFQRLVRKCRLYSAWGIPHHYCFRSR
jgi:Uma2 family endonuclease